VCFALEKFGILNIRDTTIIFKIIRKQDIVEVMCRNIIHKNIVTDFINALPGNSSVNAVQHATIEEAVFWVRGDVTQRSVLVT
jgi:hypothetical protein